MAPTTRPPRCRSAAAWHPLTHRPYPPHRHRRHRPTVRRRRAGRDGDSCGDSSPQPLLRRPVAMALIVSWMPRSTSSSCVAGAVAAQQLDLHARAAGRGTGSGCGCCGRASGCRRGGRREPVIRACHVAVRCVLGGDAVHDPRPQDVVVGHEGVGVARADRRGRSWPAPCPCCRDGAEERPAARTSARSSAGRRRRRLGDGVERGARRRTSRAASAGTATSRTPTGWPAGPRCGRSRCATPGATADVERRDLADRRDLAGRTRRSAGSSYTRAR